MVRYFTGAVEVNRARGIRAVSVFPGVIITEGARESVPADILPALNKHNQTAREGRPEDIANLVSFLASDKAGFITGITIQADGGLTAHFPVYADDTYKNSPRSKPSRR